MLAAHDVERALRRAGVGRARRVRGRDRRADRPVGAAPDPHGGPRGRAQRAHRLRGRAHASASPTSRCSSAGSRPAAPTRSGCTSRPSATRWWATPRTAATGPASRSTARSSTPAAGVRPPGHRRRRGGRGAAGPGPRGGARRLASAADDPPSVVGRRDVGRAGTVMAGEPRSTGGRRDTSSAAVEAVRRGSSARPASTRPTLAPMATVAANAVALRTPAVATNLRRRIALLLGAVSSAALSAVTGWGEAV